MKKAIGSIISGSLTDGLTMRLAPGTALETIKTGKFLCIAGTHHQFFSLITDLSLEVTNPDILLFPPSQEEPLLSELLSQKDIYATAVLKPMLMLSKDLQPMPVKTIPPHFAQVYEADQKDVALIFGDEAEPTKKYFNIGCPLDMTTPVCLNLERLTERSNGIFGKTGTGKTLLTAKYKHESLATLLAQGENLKEFATTIGAHPESIAALYRKLKRVERLPFFVDNPSPSSRSAHNNSVIDQMIEYIDKGINVIVEFGNYTQTFIYLLIANIITRRIHKKYIEKTERFLGSQNIQDEPKKLMITIEEAHKFLNPQAARQTIFGIIAREMRKYYVSLLIVDQRPSGIDEEILSQIGTKVVAQLNDEKDIQAVLTGVSNASNLRTILSSLDSKKQVLLLGHAVTMPVVVQTRECNEDFYRAMADEVTTKQIDELMNELF